MEVEQTVDINSEASGLTTTEEPNKNNPEVLLKRIDAGSCVGVFICAQSDETIRK